MDLNGTGKRGLRSTGIAALALLCMGLPNVAQLAVAADDELKALYIYAEDSNDPEFHSMTDREGQPGTVPEESPDGGEPAPSPTPTETPGLPTEPEEEEKPGQGPENPEPEPEPPALEVPAPVFVPGPGAYELKGVSWNQMSAKQVCADVTVRGTGGTVENWYLTMNAATVPFNHDFGPGNYQFPTWGYGFEGGFDGSGKIKIVGNNYSQWNNFSTLTAGQERTLKICNWNTPKPPVTTEAEVIQLSANPGEWTWSASYRGSSPIHSSPGPGDLKITQVSENVYDIEGIGWPNMGIRQDKSIEFRLGR